MLCCSFLSLCTNGKERRGGREYLVLFADVDLNRIFVPSVDLLFLPNADVMILVYCMYFFYISSIYVNYLGQLL